VILASVGKLEGFPKIGRPVPETEGRNDVRELIFQGYRIIYPTRPEQVLVIARVHGSRNLEGKEVSPWEVV